MRLVLLLLVLAPALAAARPAKNGTVLADDPWKFGPYVDLPIRARSQVDEKTYREVASDANLELRELTYVSSGLRIKALLWRPKSRASAKLPLVIYNHGGWGPDSAIGANSFETIWEMWRLAREGFVVLASQYRGVGGSEGTDEAGGADLDDVLALFPLAASLGYVDMNRVFMFGFSRGTLTTLQALRAKARVVAVALVGTAVDWNDTVTRNPGLKPPPGSTTPREIERRSPLSWANELDTPMLLIHGAADIPTPVSLVLDFAKKLDARLTLYELHVFARNDHSVFRNREDRLRLTIEWFKHPRKMSIAQVVGLQARDKGMKAAIAEARKLRTNKLDRFDWDERELNLLGYITLFSGRAEDALAVFELNSELHPKSSNVWDSLAEAHATLGHDAKAIELYKRSLALDPKNDNATQQLERLRKKARSGARP